MLSQQLLKKTYNLLLVTILLINLGLVVIVFTPLFNYLFSFLEVPSEIKKSDAIILLSAGTYESNLLSGNGYRRIWQAYSLYKGGLAPKIIISGGEISINNAKISNALAMWNILKELRIPKKDIFLEETSADTYENLLNAKEIMHKNHLYSALLVTSCSHMYRSMQVSSKLGIKNIYPAPVFCYEKNLTDAGLKTRHLFNILREYGAIIYFKIRGWI